MNRLNFASQRYLHVCSSNAQPLLLTLDKGYLLTASLPDLQRGIAPLGPPAPTQPRLLGRGVGPPGHRPWPQAWGCSSWPLPLAPGVGVWGSSSRPPPSPDLGWGVAPLGRRSLALSASAPDLQRRVTPLGRRPLGMGSSRLLSLTSDVGYLLSAVLSAPVVGSRLCLVRQSLQEKCLGVS